MMPDASGVSEMGLAPGRRRTVVGQGLRMASVPPAVEVISMRGILPSASAAEKRNPPWTRRSRNAAREVLGHAGNRRTTSPTLWMSSSVTAMAAANCSV